MDARAAQAGRRWISPTHQSQKPARGSRALERRARMRPTRRPVNIKSAGRSVSDAASTSSTPSDAAIATP